MWDFTFFFTSLSFGVGLAMDAFSVSLANGLNERLIKKSRVCLIAGVFGGFQAIMPFLGWFLVHTLVQYLTILQKFIPFIALAILLFIGIKMIIDGIKHGDCESCCKLSFTALIVQGLATSMDALSVGFNIQTYDFLHALVYALIIGLVTFGICVVGVIIGKTAGTKLSSKATIFGGALLILIGVFIFVRGII